MSNNVELNEYYYNNNSNELFLIHYYNTRFVYVSKMVLKSETKTIKINESLKLEKYNSEKYDFNVKTYSSIRTEKVKMSVKDFYFETKNTFKCNNRNYEDIRLRVNFRKEYRERNSFEITNEERLEDIIYLIQKKYIKDVIKELSEYLLDIFIKNDELLSDERENHKEYNAKQKEYFESKSQIGSRRCHIKMLKTFKDIEDRKFYLEKKYCSREMYEIIKEYLNTIDIKID